MDGQPVWMKTRSGPILSVPYPHEVNDIPMIALHHGAADKFADVIVDNFEEMLEQSKDQSLVYGVSIHAFLVGFGLVVPRARSASARALRMKWISSFMGTAIVDCRVQIADSRTVD